MRKLVLRSGFLALVLLLFVACNVSVDHALEATHASSKTVIKREYALVVFAELTCNTSGAENSERTLDANSFVCMKHTIDLYAVIDRVTHQLHLHRFSQYTQRFLNFAIRKRKANLFFPFHYFW